MGTSGQWLLTMISSAPGAWDFLLGGMHPKTLLI